jgi:hypothetical protein
LEEAELEICFDEDVEDLELMLCFNEEVEVVLPLLILLTDTWSEQPVMVIIKNNDIKHNTFFSAINSVCPI